MAAAATPLLVFEHRFVRDPSGKTWTKTQCDYSSWKPYIDVFGSLKVLARVSFSTLHPAVIAEPTAIT